MDVVVVDSDTPFSTPFLPRIESPGSPLAFPCHSLVDKRYMEGAGRQEPASTPQAPGKVGALAHPPPFTWVVGLPRATTHGMINSLCTVVLRWVNNPTQL